MAQKHTRVTEAEVSIAVLRIASNQLNGIATFQRIRKELPDYLDLSEADRTESVTRPNEALWEQLVRNIKSHSDVPGNILAEGYVEHLPRIGYKITSAGRLHLKHKGY